MYMVLLRRLICDGGVFPPASTTWADLSRVSAPSVDAVPVRERMYSWARTQAASYMAWVHAVQVATSSTWLLVLRSDGSLHQPTLGLSHIIL